jgi:tetratricopeptide (TPR) repeat protein
MVAKGVSIALPFPRALRSLAPSNAIRRVPTPHPSASPSLRRSAPCALAVATLVLAFGGTVDAQSPEVVALFERGLEAYRAGQYEDAAALFAEAHAIEPVADLTYNRARALENLGRLTAAADAYALYLEENPSADDRAGIERRIETLRDRARAESEREEPEPAAPAPTPTNEETSTGPGAWPWIVLGTGIATAGTGGLFAGLAQAAFDRASAPGATQTDSVEDEQRANDFATVSTVLFIAGGTIIAGGLTWLIAAIASE